MDENRSLGDNFNRMAHWLTHAYTIQVYFNTSLNLHIHSTENNSLLTWKWPPARLPMNGPDGTWPGGHLAASPTSHTCQELIYWPVLRPARQHLTGRRLGYLRLALSLTGINLRCYTVLFVHTICIYFRYGCKLNSSVLVWFIWSEGWKRVVTEYATDLHCRVIYHLVN